MKVDPNWIITAEQLQKQIDDVILVDVRQPSEFELSHIAGCKLIPLDQIPTRAEAELNPQDDIVLYCGIGVRSLQALLMLKSLGFEKLRSLDGGITAWKEFKTKNKLPDGTPKATH